MLLGPSTRIYWETGLTLEESIRHAKSCASAVEVWCEPPMLSCWCAEEEIREQSRLRELIGGLGIHVTVHAPRADVNLASWNPLVVEESVRQITHAFAYAEGIKASAVTFHPGGYYVDREAAAARLQDSLRVLNEAAAGYKTVACIENPGKKRTLCQSPEELADALRGLENIYVTVDIAHAEAQEGLKPADFLDALSERIQHVHVSDIKDRIPAHLPLGDGDIRFMPWLTGLRDLGYQGAFTIEGVVGETEKIEEEARLLAGLLEKAGFKSQTDP